MQLNALFCCLWHNVEASCRKHFVVFSCNQHRRLLPAMCHAQLAGWWLWSTGDRVDNTWPVAVLTAGSKAICRLRITFLPTLPAFDSPVTEVPVGILPCRLVQKNYNGLATRW